MKLRNITTNAIYYKLSGHMERGIWKMEFGRWNLEDGIWKMEFEAGDL